jgi:DNA-binding response OmpR family regulator
MRVLLIEDSERLQRTIAAGLRKAGYALDVTGDGNEGLWYARSNDYDVIILDLMLPGLDGLSLLRRLRQGGHESHVLILTAKDTVEDRVVGLRTGADDYLVKPFAFDELLARVQALARRRHGLKNPQISLGELRVDTAGRTVWRGERQIELSAREYAVLEYLLLRQGRVVTRAEVEQHVYDDRAEPMSNVVDATVYSLRKKIDVAGEPSLIQTRRGMGYVMQSPTPPARHPEPAAEP